MFLVRKYRWMVKDAKKRTRNARCDNDQIAPHFAQEGLVIIDSTEVTRMRLMRSSCSIAQNVGAIEILARYTKSERSLGAFLERDSQQCS
jgi:hypothetical protein